MDFDFSQQYQSYSNIELLKIIRLKSDYQPDAVFAAERILNEREISAEEIAEVDEYFAGLALTQQKEEQRTTDLKKQAKELFDPALNPQETTHPEKWVKFFLFIVALQYLQTLYSAAMRFYYLSECSYCSADMTDYFIIPTVFYIPAIFWLTLRRRRWGWILLFANSLMSLILLIASGYAFFRYQSIHNGNTSSFLFSLLSNAALIIFLWRESIAQYFNVGSRTKLNTAAITGGLTIIFLAGVMILSANF